MEGESAEIDFSEQNIRDSQLRMLFAVCNPVIASEAQIGLALRILCGFGIEEIAEAFLSSKETINKRLFRAKERMRTEGITLKLPGDAEIASRLDNVLRVIYLLFNEGYYSRTRDQILRKDFCLEALRLGLMLTEHPRTDMPKTNALIALMCFHSSRFDARQSGDEPLSSMSGRIRILDRELIGRGWHFLDLSARGDHLSSYHLEARIASWHSIKEDTPAKNGRRSWTLQPTPAGQLFAGGRAEQDLFAHKARGVEPALREAEELNLEGQRFRLPASRRAPQGVRPLKGDRKPQEGLRPGRNGVGKARHHDENRKHQKGRDMNTVTANTLNPDTFLPPVDHPGSLLMKLGYYFSRRQFGKVFTPMQRVFRTHALPHLRSSRQGLVTRQETGAGAGHRAPDPGKGGIDQRCHFCMDAARYAALRGINRQQGQV